MRPTLRGITVGDRMPSFGDIDRRKSIRIGVLDPERLPGSTPEYRDAPCWGRFYGGAVSERLAGWSRRRYVPKKVAEEKEKNSCKNKYIPP